MSWPHFFAGLIPTVAIGLVVLAVRTVWFRMYTGQPPRSNQGGDELPLHIATEPLVGYRSWMVMPEADGSGLALESIHMSYQWTAGVNEARCVASGPNRVVHAGPAPDVDCACGLYCVDASTKVLTRDLRWVPAGDLTVGDQLYAVEEYGQEKEPYRRRYGGEWRTLTNAGRRQRRYQDAVVTAHKLVEAKAVHVNLENGETLTCTPDHPLLVRAISSVGGAIRDYHWMPASQLTSNYQLAKLMDPWGVEPTWEAGWLAGMYDGEGSFGRSSGRHKSATSLNIAQRAGPVLDEIERLTRDRKFDYWMGGGGGTNRDVWYLKIRGGYPEVLRLLGTIRPIRLLAKLEHPDARAKEWVRVHDVTPAGVRSIATMSTSSKTFITEGYVSHNCAAADHPISEWENLIQSRVHATGMVAMSGRIIECTAGFKAGRAEIISPVILETPCQATVAVEYSDGMVKSQPCPDEVVGIGLPVSADYRYRAACPQHLGQLAPGVVVNAQIWIQVACRVLSSRYGVEVVSWSNL